LQALRQKLELADRSGQPPDQKDVQDFTNLRNQQLSTVANDLREVQTKKFDVLERLNAAKDVMSRLAMVAPVSGKVVNLAIHTKGAVLKPGDTVMEIVPAEDELEIEAHVRPDDADTIQRGMEAHVSFNAYKQRRLPQLTGKVSNVSPTVWSISAPVSLISMSVTVERNVLRITRMFV
jgi:multidrug resistance efflux pump